MTRAELARRIMEKSHLTGHFRLRSGALSTAYFDKYQFESDPVLLQAIAVAMRPLIPPGVDALAGLELGGIPLVTLLTSGHLSQDHLSRGVTSPQCTHSIGNSYNLHTSSKTSG